MAKKFWQTWTLFIQYNTGKMKWSYKHDHCIKCGTCNHKYKGNWLCTSCWDRQRDRDPKRIATKRKAWNKYHKKNYKPVVTKDTTREYRSKVINIISNKREIRNKASRKYYYNHRIMIRFQERVKTMKKNWQKPMQLYIAGQTVELPFETLERPKNTSDPRYQKWVRDMRDLDEIRQYFLLKKDLKKQ